MKESEAVRLFETLRGAYPAHPIQPETLAVYSELLSDLDAALARKAVVRHVGTNKWFPTIAEIRELAAAMVTPGAEQSAEEAWQATRKALRGWSRYGDKQPTFGNPITAEVVKTIGWMTFADSTEPERSRRDFVAMYEIIRKRHIETANVGELPTPTIALLAEKNA